MKTTKKQLAGFTLTELVVLMGVGSVLAGLLVADLSQTKTKFFQQACAANMKHWGMAFNMYAQDYSSRLYYDVGGAAFDDPISGITHTNVYLRYLGGGDPTPTIRTMRVCPARIGQTDPLSTHSYVMPIGYYKKGLVYRRADVAGSPFYDQVTNSYFPSLQFLPQPSAFLLLIEGNGNTMSCGDLIRTTTTLHVGTGGDTIPAIDFHGGGGVNCLFGDFHVEFVSSQVISNQNAISCTVLPGNPWFTLN